MRSEQDYSVDESPLFRLDPIVVLDVVGVEIEWIEKDKWEDIEMLPDR